MTESVAESEVMKVRERVHKLNDMVQGHDGMLREHALMLKVLNDQVDRLRATSATSVELQAAVATLALKIDHVVKTMEPIQKGIYWTVALILAAVIVAILALVIRQ